MKLTVFSVEKLANAYPGKKPYFAYPVESGFPDNKVIFYFGVHPVIEKGYGLNTTRGGMRFRTKGGEEYPVEIVPFSYMYVEEQYYLIFKEKYYFSLSKKRSLLLFGFDEETLEGAKVQIDLSFLNREIDFNYQEINQLIETFEKAGDVSSPLYKKLCKEKEIKFRPSFYVAKYKLQEEKK